jgi:hypothetical protein
VGSPSARRAGPQLIPVLGCVIWEPGNQHWTCRSTRESTWLSSRITQESRRLRSYACMWRGPEVGAPSRVISPKAASAAKIPVFMAVCVPLIFGTFRKPAEHPIKAPPGKATCGTDWKPPGNRKRNCSDYSQIHPQRRLMKESKRAGGIPGPDDKKSGQGNGPRADLFGLAG